MLTLTGQKKDQSFSLRSPCGDDILPSICVLHERKSRRQAPERYKSQHSLTRALQRNIFCTYTMFKASLLLAAISVLVPQAAAVCSPGEIAIGDFGISSAGAVSSASLLHILSCLIHRFQRLEPFGTANVVL